MANCLNWDPPMDPCPTVKRKRHGKEADDHYQTILLFMMSFTIPIIRKNDDSKEEYKAPQNHFFLAEKVILHKKILPNG
jgi:hypothetical protein